MTPGLRRLYRHPPATLADDQFARGSQYERSGAPILSNRSWRVIIALAAAAFVAAWVFSAWQGL